MLFFGQTQYTFSHVFDEFADQKTVFEQAALPLAEDVVKGKNGTHFADGL